LFGLFESIQILFVMEKLLFF